MRKSPAITILAATAVFLTFLCTWMYFKSNERTYRQSPIVQQIQTFNYPINMEVTSYLGNNNLNEEFVAKALANKLISVMQKVTYNETTKSYVYSYKISYSGKKSCLLNWDLLDKLHNSEMNLIELTPDSVKEFEFSSPQAPLLSETKAFIYCPKVSGKNTVWKRVDLVSQPGPLPQSVQAE